jgi:hypothetical protein
MIGRGVVEWCDGTPPVRNTLIITLYLLFFFKKKKIPFSPQTVIKLLRYSFVFLQNDEIIVYQMPTLHTGLVHVLLNCFFIRYT